MKVLWFSATPLSLNAGENTGVEGKGWISSLLQLALAIEGLELVVAYENYSPDKKEIEESGRLKIIPINISRYSKREIIKDMMTKKEVDESDAYAQPVEQKTRFEEWNLDAPPPPAPESK